MLALVEHWHDYFWNLTILDSFAWKADCTRTRTAVLATTVLPPVTRHKQLDTSKFIPSMTGHQIWLEGIDVVKSFYEITMMCISKLYIFSIVMDIKRWAASYKSKWTMIELNDWTDAGINSDWYGAAIN